LQYGFVVQVIKLGGLRGLKIDSGFAAKGGGDNQTVALSAWNRMLTNRAAFARAPVAAGGMLPVSSDSAARSEPLCNSIADHAIFVIKDRTT
jgi:hypothetical protein